MRARTKTTLFEKLAKLPYSKSCAAVTCTEIVNPGRIFCQGHWFLLPVWLREAIVNTFKDAEWDAHQEAIAQAADHIDQAFIDGRAHVAGVATDGSYVNYEGNRL